ncbi:unnamed protein product, partial [Ectocarpus fasciculatus]
IDSTSSRQPQWQAAFLPASHRSASFTASGDEFVFVLVIDIFRPSCCSLSGLVQDTTCYRAFSAALCCTGSDKLGLDGLGLRLIERLGLNLRITQPNVSQR